MPDVMLFVAPDFQQVPASSLMSASPGFDALQEAVTALQSQVSTLQGQVSNLETRVAALEAASPPARR